MQVSCGIFLVCAFILSVKFLHRTYRQHITIIKDSLVLTVADIDVRCSTKRNE